MKLRPDRAGPDVNTSEGMVEHLPQAYAGLQTDTSQRAVEGGSRQPCGQLNKAIWSDHKRRNSNTIEIFG